MVQLVNVTHGLSCALDAIVLYKACFGSKEENDQISVMTVPPPAAFVDKKARGNLYRRVDSVLGPSHKYTGM